MPNIEIYGVGDIQSYRVNFEDKITDILRFYDEQNKTKLLEETIIVYTESKIYSCHIQKIAEPFLRIYSDTKDEALLVSQLLQKAGIKLDMEIVVLEVFVPRIK